MKTKILFWFCIVSLCSSCFLWRSTPKKGDELTEKLPKKLRKEISKNFVYLPQDSLRLGTYLNGSDKFSLLIHSRKFFTKGFFIAKYEVTMGDYMDYYRQIATQTDLPDTNCFDRIVTFPWGNNKSQYFSQQEFRAHPICGVSYKQAENYCKWKTQKTNEYLGQEGYKIKVKYRLPTADELEYVIQWNGDKAYNYFDVWKALQNANVGELTDENNVFLKSLKEDGYYDLAPVNTFKQTAEGICSIWGNVAEWTSSTPKEATSIDTLSMGWIMEPRLQRKLQVERKQAAEKNKENKEIEGVYTHLAIKRSWVGSDTVAEELNAYNIYHNPQYRIVKGGSFYHGAYYIQPAAIIPLKESEQHAWLGFRMVLEVVKQ